MPKGGGATRGRGRRDVGAYPRAADLARPGGRVGMPRLPRLHAPGGTVHVVGRCHNRECCFTTPADFLLLTAQLAAMARTYEVTLYAYTLMANHVHLLLQAPPTDPLYWGTMANRANSGPSTA